MEHHLSVCQAPWCNATEVHGHNDGGWLLLPRKENIMTSNDRMETYISSIIYQMSKLRTALADGREWADDESQGRDAIFDTLVEVDDQLDTVIGHYL